MKAKQSENSTIKLIISNSWHSSYFLKNLEEVKSQTVNYFWGSLLFLNIIFFVIPVIPLKNFLY